MAEKPEQIRELEQRLGFALQEVALDEIWKAGMRYSLDKQGNIRGLNLGYCQTQDLSPLASLTALTLLHLNHNQIQDLSPLASLTALTHLRLNGNQIQDLSPLASLTALTHLHLNGNQIQDLSPLASLTALTHLHLYANQIQDLSPLEPLARSGLKFKWTTTHIVQGIAIAKNPLQRPPLEIAQQGHDAIMAWFDAQSESQRPLNEVKILLVGAGGSGKTSLVKAIRGKKHDPKESQTHGIRIEFWPFTCGDQDVRARLWDFGGQEIMHATHQFFMSHRSLYILVLDGRKEQNTEEYWLKHIESFGGDSPILVVINKIDENPGYDVDRRALKRKYPNIVGFHRISCQKREGIEAFIDALKTALADVEMLVNTWPETWFHMKTHLENLGKPYIDYDDYLQICQDEGLEAENQQTTLLQYLNDLGIALHFPKLKWLGTHVLKPMWITDAVYQLINHKKLAKGQGIFAMNDLRQILPKFPKPKYPFLIELMKEFKLCYQLPDGRILVPDLLQVGEPELDLDETDSLRMVVTYHFLPRSILPRLMVNLHNDVQTPWRTGMLLQPRSFKASAVVRVDYEESQLTVAIKGTQARDYLAVLRHQLGEIHGGFTKIGAVQKLPCICEVCSESETPEFFPLQQLISFYANGYEHWPCPRLQHMVSIKDLLGEHLVGDAATLQKVLDLLKEHGAKLNTMGTNKARQALHDLAATLGIAGQNLMGLIS